MRERKLPGPEYEAETAARDIFVQQAKVVLDFYLEKGQLEFDADIFNRELELLKSKADQLMMFFPGQSRREILWPMIRDIRKTNRQLIAIKPKEIKVLLDFKD